MGETFELDGAGHFRKLDLDRARQALTGSAEDPMLSAMDKARDAGREQAARMATDSARSTRTAKAAQAQELKDAYQEAVHLATMRVRTAAVRACLAGKDPIKAIDEESRRMRIERLIEDTNRITKGGK